MSSSCKQIRQELIDCILASDCIKKHPGRTFRDCLKSEHDDEVDYKCRMLQRSYFECRRGMLDMRNRFRGN
ncbi:cytochrome c oxidase assembly protein PET191, partial [Paraphysoderma sedebokerense]